jgi:cell division protein FtsB
MNHVLGVDITLSNLLTGLAVVAIVALVIAYFVYNFRNSGSQARDKALKNWKDLAESEQAKNAQLVKENERLSAEVRDCAQLRDDFAQHVLRSTAREINYQRCINRLEVMLKLEPTNFDDLTQHHTSQTPDR